MAVLVVLVMFLTMAGGTSGAQWCVCRSDLSDQALQKTLDYACGAGADCNPVLQNGACFQPNTVKAHCSYAANSYFQRKGQAAGTCDFSNTAMISTTDPSTGGTCSYPSSASSTTPATGTPATTVNPGTGTTPSTTTNPNTPPTTTNPNTPTTTTNPNTFTPIGGGISSGLGPTGITTDQNGGFVSKAGLGLLTAVLWFSGMFYFEGFLR